MSTIAELIRKRANDQSPGLAFENERFSWATFVQACVDRAHLLAEMRKPGPFHVGILLDNLPEYPMWLGAVALAGAAAVGINPTRRGGELGRDITHADCQLIVTEGSYLPLLSGLDLGVSEDRVLEVGSQRYSTVLDPHRGSQLDSLNDNEILELSVYLLIFTSGTSGAPKACLCSQGRLAGIGESVATGFGLSSADVCYLAMPLFHSNALMAGWAPALAAGATVALRRKFSASGFLPDVRRFGVTYFNYVGKPLTYICATEERPDDGENSLRIVFGNEGAGQDLERFARRFGCTVLDAYGATEGGVNITRSPGAPPGSLGRAPRGTVVLDPETGSECAPARFDGKGRLLNPDEAIGELASRLGAGSFEGYWKNEEANKARFHDGIYWTGDLAYRDEEGFVYFAGRDYDWLRVDGENFAAAPIERILCRHPDVLIAAVYAVPDPDVGDQAMAALQLRAGSTFEPQGLAVFLDEQPDMGTKWSPRFVRIVEAMPVTPTNKVLKRQLRNERWECDDPVWWRPDRSQPYRSMTTSDIEKLHERFASRGRLAALDTS